MKRSASESKPFKSRSKVEILGGLGGKRTAEARSKLKQALLINSDAE